MIFDHLELYPGDPILSLMDKYVSDPRPEKVNLSIGFYYDENGNVPVLESVRAAKQVLDNKPAIPNLYLPMDGEVSYRTAVQHHLFGQNSSDTRIVTLQTPGGSGALRVAADFLKAAYPGGEVWLSAPTWDNHEAIFSRAGFNIQRYEYLNGNNTGVDFPALISSILLARPYSVILLHACCHNPTGFDLLPEQWDEIFLLCRQKKLIPLLDAAYLGLGDGMEQDSYAIRRLVSSDTTGLVSNSFSKIFSLYGERVGSLSVICSDDAIVGRVSGQLKAAVRANYSNPPRYGASLVSEILSNKQHYNLWKKEVDGMRARIVAMRYALHLRLNELCPTHNHDALLKQKGMFSFTGLSVEQVQLLREEFGVYLIGNGRMCVAGLNEGNLNYVAESIAAVL